jgi:tetratricopeptide (TPR) repeat protein
MKKSLLLFFVLLNLLAANAQQIPDSVLTGYRTSVTQGTKNVFIRNYLSSFANDSTRLAKSQDLLIYLRKNNDEAGADIVEARIAMEYGKVGEYATALSRLFPILTRMENRKDTLGMLDTYLYISGIYASSDNYLHAIATLKKTLPLTSSANPDLSIDRFYFLIATYYAEANLPDSGIYYAQKTVALAEQKNEKWQLSYALNSLAANYIAKGDYDIALPILRKAFQYRPNIMQEDNHFLYNDFAQLFLAEKQYDSTYFYASKAINFAVSDNDLQQQARAYEYLYKCFDQSGQIDSSNKYFRLAATIKESIYSADKIKAIEAVNFKEQLLQQELDEQQLEQQNERKQNIQYALMAIGIVAFIILFILLSRSIIVTEKWISFFGILGLLIVFEFINLLIHPFLERITHHSPLLMLMALVVLASLLIPLHHRMEKWIKVKMTEKNKKVRLENAKKTLEELGES